MNNVYKVILMVFLIGISTVSQAEFIEQDLFIAGDKSVLTDTNSNLSWLDLNITNSDSYNETITRLSEDLSNFRLATEAEIVNLFASIFPSLTGVIDGFVNISDSNVLDEMTSFYTLLGGSNSFLYGNFYDDSGARRLAGLDLGLGWYQGASNIRSYAHWDDNTPVGHGVFLVQEVSAVPIPSAISLFLIGMFGFVLKRKS